MQCAKRLYLEYHHPEEVPEPTVGRQALQEAGARLLELACQGFPKGRRIDAEDMAQAAEQTHEILSQEEGTAVFDAAFVFEQAEVRCDIVLPTGRGELDIFEVKSGTKVKPRHIMDFALQMYVIEACGHTVRNASILHLDAIGPAKGLPCLPRLAEKRCRGDRGCLYGKLKKGCKELRSYRRCPFDDGSCGNWTLYLKSARKPDLSSPIVQAA